MVVDVYYKQANSDLWKITRYKNETEKIVLQSLGIEVTMADLYCDIKY